MNIEKEIRQLKFQIKLLKFMVNADEFPFFMYALDHEFDENQVNVVLEILYAFNYRLYEGTDENFHKYHEINKEDEKLKSLLKTFQIDITEIYKIERPSIQEFEFYLNCIFGDKEVNSKHILLSIKKQSTHRKLCDYLLDQIDEQ